MSDRAFSQSGQQLSLESPFGKDKLLLRALTGREDVSRPFMFHLEMLSRDRGLSPQTVVGKPVSVTLKLPDDSSRFFHGVISSFSNCGTDDRFSHYHAQIVPWLWFLNLRFDCRIFQTLSVPQIIEQVFTGAGLTDFEKSEINGSHPKRDYCVQYRESDFNFVSRLMEQEGIFYYFRHEQGRHVLVLADQMGAFKDCPENQLDFAAVQGAQEATEKLTSWTHRYQFHSGKCSHTDYNFETPSASLMVSTNTVVKWNDIKKYEVYDYPGAYPDQGWGKAELKLRMEEAEVCHDMVEGSGACRSFTAGGKFKIGSHQNKSEEGQTYALLSVGHSISLGGAYISGGSSALEYSNGFTCIPIATAFRPPRATPKPLVQGVQPAVVVGPGGEEIYTDKYGRVKVQFFWDRQGKKDDKSSCWLRVSQPWAGKNWGAIAIPRIGQEVLVGFLEGDPDRPIITGRVYNAEQMPPYDLPANKTQSGVQTRSSKQGTPGNFNQIRFEDNKGSEELYIHAEKDKKVIVEHDRSEQVGHDERIAIGNNRTESVGHDENISIGNNRTENVEKNENISIGENRNTDVGKNEEVTVGENRTESVGKKETITIGENREEQVGKDEKLEVAGNREDQIGKDDKTQVGKKYALIAGDEITLTTGDASLTMKKDGTIQIKGKDITIVGSGKIGVKASGDLVLKGSKIAEN